MENVEMVNLEFRGGPWDGGKLEFSPRQADVGYPVEWQIKMTPDGSGHLYESVGPMLEGLEVLVLEYRGSTDEDEWRPGGIEFISDEDGSEAGDVA